MSPLGFLGRILLPWGAGPDPSHSAQYRAACRALDAWSTFTVVANCVTALRWDANRIGLQSDLVMTSVVWLLWVALQHLWSRARPDSYYKHRHYVQVAHRLCRLAASPSTTWRWARASLPLAPPAYLGSPLWPALTFTMAISGCMQAVSHSVAAPLPFLPQLLLQCLHTFVFFTSQAAPAVACLELSPYTTDLRILCATLSDILVPFSPPTRSSPPLLSPTCSDTSPLVLVLFVYLFVFFSLPLLITFRYDQQLVWCLRLEALAHPQPLPQPLPHPLTLPSAAATAAACGNGPPSSAAVATAVACANAPPSSAAVAGSSKQAAAQLGTPPPAIGAVAAEPMLELIGPAASDKPSVLRLSDLPLLLGLAMACWVAVVAGHPLAARALGVETAVCPAWST